MSGPPKPAPRNVVPAKVKIEPLPIDLDAEIARLRERLGLLPIPGRK